MGNWKSEKKELEAKVAKLEAEKTPTENGPQQDVTPSVDAVQDVPKEQNVKDSEIDAAIARGNQMVGATRPWEKKSDPRPWRMDMLKVVGLKPGLRPYWALKENVEKRMLMGYIVARRGEHVESKFQNPMAQGKDMGSYITIGNHVLMVTPMENHMAQKEAEEAHRKRLEIDTKTRVREAAKQIAAETGLGEIEVTEEK